MATSGFPLRKDYVILQGDTLSLSAVYKAGEPAEPVDMAGWTGEWGVQRTIGDVEEVWKVDLTLGNDGTITASHDTTDWPKGGKFTHQVRVISPAGVKKTLSLGLIDFRDASLVESL